MPMPVQLKDFDIALNVNSAATITAGFTVAVCIPARGEVVSVYIGPIDGTTAIGGTTGAATIVLSSGGAAGATVIPAPAATGLSIGTTAASGAGMSARQFVNEGDMLKIVFTPGSLTCAVNAVITVIVRVRSI